MVNKQTKEIIFGQEVRDKILKGVAITARAVGTTLGSKGRNVSLEKNWGSPIIIHDGVTVARDVVLPDPFENQAAQLVINAAQNTNNEAGDGTTTATILTHAIVKEALPIVSAGTNPMVIRKGIEKAIPAVIERLLTIAKPVASFDEMKQIATISSTDEGIGELVATAVQKVGEYGVVTVQNGNKSYIEVEYKEGMDLSAGWLAPHFVTDMERFEAIYGPADKIKTIDSKYPFVVLLDDKLDTTKMIDIFRKLPDDRENTKILVIANDYEPEAIQGLVLSKLKSDMKVVAIKSPEYGEHRTNLLDDIATVTGGTVIGGTNGIPIENLERTHFGKCEKFVVTRYETIIIGGKGDGDKIKKRIKGLQNIKKETQDKGQLDKIESRLAKLIGGVAVIMVGAASQEELREKKERVIDAVNATKAAVKEGVVPGGGVAFIRAGEVIESLELTDREKIGADIVKRALRYPIMKLVSNAGADDPGFVVGKILENKNPFWGYNVESEDYEDMVKSGIIDPVKVSRTALENAASIATMLITTDVMIVNKREPGKKEEDTDGIGELI